MTLLETLIQRIRKAGEHNRNAEVAPAVILWPDRDRQWEPLLPALRKAMPELYCHGSFAAEERTGPAIWLRCVLAGTVPHGMIGKGVPVLYLPGIGRGDLRAVESCPRELQPLAELQYRGSFFGHSNGKDWTVSAFLGSGREGLGLDLAEDQGTQTALRQVLRRLADVRLKELEGRRLEAADFYELLSPDLDRDLLRWMENPDA
ncbi:MAG TPA: BREX-1 system phosphatase PglZ type B, partial [Myxococcota bacterium]|nr:BREX-1 system phosphatase PglZ type B [Myxococcota bacterium]